MTRHAIHLVVDVDDDQVGPDISLALLTRIQQGGSITVEMLREVDEPRPKTRRRLDALERSLTQLTSDHGRTYRSVAQVERAVVELVHRVEIAERPDDAFGVTDGRLTTLEEQVTELLERQGPTIAWAERISELGKVAEAYKEHTHHEATHAHPVVDIDAAVATAIDHRLGALDVVNRLDELERLIQSFKMATITGGPRAKT